MDISYETLDATLDFEERNRIIARYIADFSLQESSPGFSLLGQPQIPFVDELPSFQFNVGDKYLRDPGPDWLSEHPVYVLGGVRTPEGRIELIIAEPDDGPQGGVGRVPREWMLPPEVMLKKKQ